MFSNFDFNMMRGSGLVRRPYRRIKAWTEPMICKADDLTRRMICKADDLTRRMVYTLGYLSFRCNICGYYNAEQAAQFEPQEPSCKKCKSTVLWRTLMHILSMELFGKSFALPDFPARPDIHGIGMSDWCGYAEPLAQKLGFRNTYYHQEPQLDITSIDPALESTQDFVICSEVFEHVQPPISVAFENLRRLLKPDGVVVFSVPYTKNERTLEHFPELHDYRIDKVNGRYTLRNTTKDGILQVFDNLVFHGGCGSTLEMRLFSESSLIEEFQQAGLGRIKIYKEPYFEHGIYWSVNWSLPMAVRIS